MGYSIRQYNKKDLPFLWEMLFQSIYVSEEEAPLSKDILGDEGIEKYMKNWGRNGDHAIIAVDEQGNSTGAVWIRKFTRDTAGYGFVDEQTPELGMALLPEYRGKGLGKFLLNEMEDLARSLELKALSLSVDPRNIPALRLYENKGYVKIEEDAGGSFTMKKDL